MIARSYLFVPADRPERYAKAIASGADAVIIDLEDAVAPDAKGSGREALNGWLAGAPAPVIVRINSADSAWFGDDLRVCRHPSVLGVMVPKSERVEDLARVAAAAPGKRLLPLVETAAGIDRARELGAAPGVERLVFGSIDFQLDLSIEGEGDALLYFRSHLVLASRLAGCAPPVDGVSTALDDPQALQSQAAQARRLGFGRLTHSSAPGRHRQCRIHARRRGTAMGASRDRGIGASGARSGRGGREDGRSTCAAAGAAHPRGGRRAQTRPTAMIDFTWTAGRHLARDWIPESRKAPAIVAGPPLPSARRVGENSNDRNAVGAFQRS